MSDVMYDQVGLDGASQYKKGQWKEFAIHDMNCIKGFFGDYRFLSNFWPVEVVLDGDIFPSTENGYQAAKFFREEREYFKTCSPADAKRYTIGKVISFSQSEWDHCKVRVMRELLVQKFSIVHHPALFQLLKDTGDRNLEETNWWEDTFWGVNLKGSGKNMLGRLLMQIRGL